MSQKMESFSYFGCEMSYPKTWWYSMPTHSEVQELRQDTAGTVCLCLVMSRASAGWLILCQLDSHLFACLAANAD